MFCKFLPGVLQLDCPGWVVPRQPVVMAMILLYGASVAHHVAMLFLSERGGGVEGRAILATGVFLTFAGVRDVPSLWARASMSDSMATCGHVLLDLRTGGLFIEWVAGDTYLPAHKPLWFWA